MRSFFRSLLEMLTVIGAAIATIFGFALLLLEPALYIAAAVWLYRHW